MIALVVLLVTVLVASSATGTGCTSERSAGGPTTVAAPPLRSCLWFPFFRPIARGPLPPDGRYTAVIVSPVTDTADLWIDDSSAGVSFRAVSVAEDVRWPPPTTPLTSPTTGRSRNADAIAGNTPAQHPIPYTALTVRGGRIVAIEPAERQRDRMPEAVLRDLCDPALMIRTLLADGWDPDGPFPTDRGPLERGAAGHGFSGVVIVDAGRPAARAVLVRQDELAVLRHTLGAARITIW